MASTPKVVSRQLQLITLLVATVAGLILLLNLTYIAESNIEEVETKIILQKEDISDVIEAAIKRDKEKPFAAIIASDLNLQTTLQATLDKLMVVKYIAILNESGEPLRVVSLDEESALNFSDSGLENLKEKNRLIQLITLLWGKHNFNQSFFINLGRDETGQGYGVKLLFGVSASEIRGMFSDVLLSNLILFVTSIFASLIISSRSAELINKPIEALSKQLEQLEKGNLDIEEENSGAQTMPRSLQLKLQLLGSRMAGERTELEVTRGQLTQIIGKIEERLLMLNPDKQVVLMSPKVDHLLGVAGINLVGAKLSDRLGSSHPLIELVDRVDQSHASVENVMLIKQIGEQPRQILALVQYIEDKSGPIGILVSLRDFDSFRQFQSQLDYSDKLAALGRITSGVAHEVKNPLNAMVIHLEILRAKLSQPNADITPQLDILSSEIKRLDRVVQTFLNFTRPLKVNLVPIDLNDLVHQVTRLAAAEAAANKVDILEELSPEFLRVNGDADLLKQAFLNIIINGCQAMPRGGPLTIRTKRTSSYAILSVSDRGVGIPEEVREKIFQLYYTTKLNGNGIGLANAFRTIQLHNGRIEFESTTEVGTTFKIFLPEV
ncbi:MAG: hypothetical protein HY819_06745 [Acidobacteria bacterium]|nr:hypothetical protein [Acidobacteriota bacterium]